MSRTTLELAGRLTGEERSYALATIVRKAPTSTHEDGAAEVAL